MSPPMNLSPQSEVTSSPPRELYPTPIVEAVKRTPPGSSGRWRFAAFALAAGVGIVIVIGLLIRWLTIGGDESAPLTVPVRRDTLDITVTERGELESSHRVDARCEVEGYQNKIVSILPEGTHVKKGDL